ncbi:unnamed protein product [Ascophyllum nodosum]
MGVIASNSKNGAIASEIRSWPNFQERTCLTSSDLSILAAAFRKALGSSENGTLKREQFEAWMDFDSVPEPVERRLFDAFCISEADQQVDLFNFVVGIWNYCLEGKSILSLLAFDIYDLNVSGTITEEDLKTMIVDMWGVDWEQDDNVKAMVEKRRDVDAMKIDKWNEFCRLHPRVLQPAFKLQQEMQELTLGRNRWAKISERVRKRREKIDKKNDNRLRAAVEEEDLQQVKAEILSEETATAVIVGTKASRMAAASKQQAKGKGGKCQPTEQTAVHMGPSQDGGTRKSWLRKSVDKRGRLNAVKEDVDTNDVAPSPLGSPDCDLTQSNAGITDGTVPHADLAATPANTSDYATSPSSSRASRRRASISQKLTPSLASAQVVDVRRVSGDTGGRRFSKVALPTIGSPERRQWAKSIQPGRRSSLAAASLGLNPHDSVVGAERRRHQSVFGIAASDISKLRTSGDGFAFQTDQNTLLRRSSRSTTEEQKEPGEGGRRNYTNTSSIPILPHPHRRISVADGSVAARKISRAVVAVDS